MTERSGSTKSSIFAAVVLLVGLYLFFTAYNSASSDPSPLRLVRTSGALVALGSLFLMIKLAWRPLVQFAVAAGLSLGLPIAYAFIWEQTPIGWILVASVFNNVLVFVIVRAVWSYIVPRARWLAWTLGVLIGLAFILSPAGRTTIGLTVLAVTLLPADRSRQATTAVVASE